MPDPSELAARLSALSTPPQKTIFPGLFGLLFGSPIQRWSMQALGFFTGQIGGPFGLKPKQTGVMAHIQWEQQHMAQNANSAHQAMVQAMNAIQLVQGSIHHVGGDIHQVASGLGRAIGEAAHHIGLE